MTLAIADFRLLYPAFQDDAIYPDAAIQLWLDQSALQMSECRWGSLFNFGQGLLTAHYLTINYGTGSGGSGSSGVVSSESVGPLSVSYDTGSTSFQSGGDLNRTSYGTQWLRMAHQVGAGGLFV